MTAEPGYWLLVRPKPAEPGRITTHAFVFCLACRKPLAGRSGPRDAICDGCLKAIRRMTAGEWAA